VAIAALMMMQTLMLRKTNLDNCFLSLSLSLSLSFSSHNSRAYQEDSNAILSGAFEVDPNANLSPTTTFFAFLGGRFPN